MVSGQHSAQRPAVTKPWAQPLQDVPNQGECGLRVWPEGVRGPAEPCPFCVSYFQANLVVGAVGREAGHLESWGGSCAEAPQPAPNAQSKPKVTSQRLFKPTLEYTQVGVPPPRAEFGSQRAGEQDDGWEAGCSLDPAAPYSSNQAPSRPSGSPSPLPLTWGLCHRALPAPPLHVTVRRREARPQPAQEWGSVPTLLWPVEQGPWDHVAPAGVNAGSRAPSSHWGRREEQTLLVAHCSYPQARTRPPRAPSGGSR